MLLKPLNSILLQKQSQALIKLLSYRNQHSYKTVAYNLSCLKNMLEQWGHQTCGSTQPMSGLTEAHSMRKNP